MSAEAPSTVTAPVLSPVPQATYFVCHPSPNMFATFELAAAHVRTAPEHAASIAQAIANGLDLDSFIAGIIVIMEVIPDHVAQAIWRHEHDRVIETGPEDPFFDMPPDMVILRRRTTPAAGGATTNGVQHIATNGVQHMPTTVEGENVCFLTVSCMEQADSAQNQELQDMPVSRSNA